MKTFKGTPFEVKCSDGKSAPKRIQVIRCGTFHHPQYGKFEITEEILRSFKKNFDDKVRGIDIAVDYKHASEDVAAAWFRALELTENDTELWADVDWTPNGEKVVSEREFRYVSADFAFAYKDNETLKEFGPVLLGAGLTNRPVVKNMKPVAAHEGVDMDKDKEIADLKAKLAEEQKSGDKIKQLETDLAAERAKTADAEKAKVLAEKKSVFDKMLADGKVCEAQREPYMNGEFAKFAELAKPIKLAEQGEGGEPDPAKPAKDASEAEDQILKLAEEKVQKKEAKTPGEAIAMVLADPKNKDLRAKYETK
jgi:phage I-like protein